MKKLILSIVVVATIPVSAQIPNPGFENWTSIGSYENPDGWATMNNTTASYSLYTATKATPGNPGNSYLKLTSKNIGGSIVNGIAVSGKLDTLSMLPISGFAFNQRPATFGGKWQHMIYGSSQGGLSVLLTKWNATQSKRDTIASGATTLAGMAMSWANFSFNIMYTDSFHFPDSCIIVLKSSGSAPSNNDYLWVDALAFTGTVAVLPPIDPVGVKENYLSESLMVFPNPSNEYLNLNIDLNEAQSITAEIFDAQGKLIYSYPIKTFQGKNSIKIDLTGIAKGSYSLKINSQGASAVRKFIID